MTANHKEELRDNIGEDARRTHNVNLANWIPDEFMRRGETDDDWSLVDPDQAPELPDLWGDAFDEAYRRAERDARVVRTVKARDLVREFKIHGLWMAEIREAIKKADGSIQGITAIPEEVRRLYRTAWELPQKTLIDLAAARAPYIDQSWSLNVFLAGPTIGKLSSMYRYAWQAGLKATYCLRSRPATRIQQVGITGSVEFDEAF